MRPGEIVLDRASRAFSVRADQGRTLKQLFVGRRRAGGPPPVQALRDVTLRVEPGETVGVVGRNGAGKTSTLKVLAGIVPLDAGTVECGGRIVSLLELGAGFGRDFTGRENIYLNGAIHGLTKVEIEERLDRIIAFSELGDFVDVPVRTYSTGMFVRLGFAIAAHLDAEILLIDEVLAVGDEAFQRKCLRRISEQIAAGVTLVLVSHDPGQIERVCERVVVLDGGEVAFDGATADGLLFYHRLLGVEEGGGGSLRAPGSRSVSVREAELLDGAGRSTRLFHAGEPLRLAVELDGHAELRLEVRDENGHAVFATRTAAAPGRLSWDVERLALLGGDYDLALGAGPEAGFERVLRFAVAAEPDAEGVVDLRGAWSTAEVTA
ncbi:MAG: tagH 3 [Solirubrobacterales bacterium]|jgi:ABC-type polysaccharide/polyol phosphate transport system ATPase subunit|nr:tagH 3 [Solirubrobacterales bacterium]